MKRSDGISRIPLVALAALAALLPVWIPAPGLATVFVHQNPVAFAWDPASGQVDHYNVYLSMDGQPYVLFTEVVSPSCQISLQDGHRYSLQVDGEDPNEYTGPVSDPSEEIAVALNGSETDTDGDGMDDAWEVSFGFNPYDPADGTRDSDGDGLINRDEFSAGTLPLNPDTDGDGVGDGVEVLGGQDPRGPADNLPVADAGEDQTRDPTVVTLDGSGSRDPNGDLLTYTWTQEEGPEVALSDPHAMTPTFLGTKWGLYRFRLSVNDGRADGLPDEVSVAIQNVAPTADAGADQVVDAGTRVVLDGSGSRDPNGDPLNYVWSQREGPAVLLVAGGSASASFVPGSSGVCRFELVVSDGERTGLPDEVEIVVNAANRVPTADAGEDQTALANGTVVLDGSGSADPEGAPLVYLWVQRDGPEAVALQEATSVRPWFVPASTGTYRFELAVDDGQDLSGPDSVTVVVEDRNQAPVARILPVDPLVVGTQGLLNGAGSADPDGDPLTYLWTQTGGAQVLLESPEASFTSFYAVTEGVLTFQLVVFDGDLYSAPASVEVLVDGANCVPVADAGNDLVGYSRKRVCLNGSASYDPDPEDSLRFGWSQTQGTRTTLVGSATSAPCFTPPKKGTYVFKLVVSDGDLASSPDSVTVRVLR